MGGMYFFIEFTWDHFIKKKKKEERILKGLRVFGENI